jgi:cell division protein ZapA
MAGQQDVTVTIYGHRYVLRSASDPSFVQELAAQIDGLMCEAAEGCGPVTADRLAVLVALNLADDLASMKKNGDLLPEPYRERIEHLIALIANEVGK